jgi:hypothetical protein
MPEESSPTATATSLPTETQSPPNTPATLGVTPRYVLQHNAISRSKHALSTTAQKLAAMAMALLPPALDSLTAAFTYTEFCKAVGYDKGGESFKLFRKALEECMGCYIALETICPQTGKRIWENYTWFLSSRFDEKTGVATMTFSPQLATAIKELKRVYAKIDLHDFGALQSKYALRHLEIAISYMSLKGKNGNNDQAWYFERSVQDLREMFCISDDIYKENRLFRQKVVEEPVKEINKAGIGIKIIPQGIKQGRNLTGFRFDCEQAPRTVQKKGKSNKSKKIDSIHLELPEETPKTACDREVKEYQHLKELYPDEFAGLYAEELARASFMPPESGFRKQAAEAAALCLLREKYGIVK